MANDAELTIRLLAKDEASKVLNDVEGHASGLGKTLSSVGSIAGGFLAANVISGGVEKLTGFIGDSINAIKESNQVSAQLDQVLKSTGASAWATADGIKAQAAAIEKNSLFEDEAILKGQNLLLTFTNITDGVDGANPIFGETTQIMVDMAAAMGTDASGAAIQLGKALNDPTQGISALSRVGVSFTEEQKKQIATMQEAGDIAGAQRIILAELNKEFGGSAKAQSDAAGSSEIYKDKMNDLQETIGAKLLPIQLKWKELQAEAIGFIAEKVLPILGSLITYLQNVGTTGDIMNDFLMNVPEPLRGIALEMGKVVVFAREQLIPAFLQVVDFVKAHWPEISAVIEFAADFIKARIEGVIQVIQGVVEVVSGVIALVQDLFHGRWAAAWQDLQDIAAGVLDIVVGMIKEQFGNIPAILLGLVGSLADAGWAMGDSIINGILSGLKAIPGVLGDLGTEVFNAIKSVINSGIDMINNAIPNEIVMPGEIPNINLPDNPIPRLKGGLSFVPMDMFPAYLDKGERVLTASQNAAYSNGGSSGGLTINLFVTGSILSNRDITNVLRDALQSGALRGYLTPA